MKKVILYFLIIFSVQIIGQNNVTLLSHINQYPSAGYNDIWGYVDGTGNEYALLGVRTGTSIVNLANPQNPVEVAFIPGPQSIWRDIKVHNSYAYVITEQTGSGQGLQIIDLSQLPTTATLVNTIDTWFSRAHNIFIDDGFAFVIGTNSGGGMHILDLSNPVNPTRTSYYTGSGYIHDVYVWNDTVVACAEDVYDLVDVTNKSNAQLISSSIALPGIYAHSGWMTEDKRYFFGTEEFNQIDITVWDLVDRTSWNLVVPTWEMSSNSTVHNLFIKGNYAHVSYYSDGYVVLDISDPLNPTLAGQYDTPNMWGCYPYLPSGITICSDIDNGLWVFQFDGVVPVELSSFTASESGNFVTLDWTTATETNNQGFEIQKKSADDFYIIGFVTGSGTTTERKNYSYKDKNLENGVYVYRLKQIDFHGTSSFSEEIMVEVSNPSSFVLNQNYPNPFNPSTNIKFSLPNSSYTNLSVYNLVGEKVSELVNEVLPEGEYNLRFDGANLPSGIYIAKLSSESFRQTIKMTLLK
ncbi:MAG: choice-of-anchor B family protein [Ignavibacteria bacterium]|nr:choice-of-anchor B family protein [Ignavibacteria bacterium]